MVKREWYTMKWTKRWTRRAVCAFRMRTPRDTWPKESVRRAQGQKHKHLCNTFASAQIAQNHRNVYIKVVLRTRSSGEEKKMKTLRKWNSWWYGAATTPMTSARTEHRTRWKEIYKIAGNFWSRSFGLLLVSKLTRTKSTAEEMATDVNGTDEFWAFIVHSIATLSLVFMCSDYDGLLS